MSEKQEMDDFASLFLPDLLNPLDSMQEEERPKFGPRPRETLLNHQISAPPSTSSSGMSLIRFFEASQQVSSLESDPLDSNAGYSDMGAYMQSQSQPSLRSHSQVQVQSQSQPSSTHVQGQAQMGTSEVSATGPITGSLYSDDCPKLNAQDSFGGETTGSLNAYPFRRQYETNSPESRNSALAANIHGLSPFSHLDMGHTSHYAEYLAPEASMVQPQIQRQYHMGQYQPFFVGGTRVPYDCSTWTGHTDHTAIVSAPMAKSVVMPAGFIPTNLDSFGSECHNVSWPDSRPVSGLRQLSASLCPLVSPPKTEDMIAETHVKTQSFTKTNTYEHPEDSIHEMDGKKATKHEKKSRAKPPLGCSVTQPISVDYSAHALSQLIDLKHYVPAKETLVASPHGIPVNFSLRGFLNGRLMTNNQDNYNYIYLSSGAVDPSVEYNPQVISCYRRNFINLHLHLIVDAPASEMFLAGEPIHRLRVEVSAITNKKDSKPVVLLDGGSEQDQKDARRVGDNISVEIIGPVHVFDVAQCATNSFWKVKKLQFKNATANSTNLAFQTYYRFLARVIAETSKGDIIIEEVASNPIIVRGRNPSFYQAKHDIMIKGKSPNIAASYQQSSLNLPLVSGSKSTSDFKIKDACCLPSANIMDGHVAEKNHSEGDLQANMKRETNNSDVEASCGEDEKPDTELKSKTNAPEALKEKEENDISSIRSGVDIQRILDAMTNKNGEKYHYFPISKVYYLPPVSVVYYPHGAHNTSKPLEEPESHQKGPPSLSVVQNRKYESKVYFR